jgi:hypothetical protein
LRSFAVLSGFALALGGCADNESMLYIQGVIALNRTDCVLNPESNAELLPGGILDQSLASGYRAALLVGSQLTQRGSREQLRTETARLSLRGAEVSLESVAGEPLMDEFSALGTGFVNPSSGTEPGFGGLIVDIIPAGVTLDDGQIIAQIRAFGETLGGQEVESNLFPFPISVCSGCLIEYPASANDQPAGAPYLCGFSADEGTRSDERICFAGQDTPISCTECSAYADVCRDPALNPSVSTEEM